VTRHYTENVYYTRTRFRPQKTNKPRKRRILFLDILPNAENVEPAPRSSPGPPFNWRRNTDIRLRRVPLPPTERRRRNWTTLNVRSNRIFRQFGSNFGITTQRRQYRAIVGYTRSMNERQTRNTSSYCTRVVRNDRRPESPSERGNIDSHDWFKNPKTYLRCCR